MDTINEETILKKGSGVNYKLNQIQTRLKAPKGQFNGFGKYNYRNCEDILESLKPLLRELDCIVLLTDEAVDVGNRIYIKATAKFVDSETGESIEVSAMAREDESKKGMDSCQLTGSTSSYARKYALNGLFAIDDNRDSDTPSVSKEMIGILKIVSEKAGFTLEQTERSVQKKFNGKKLHQLGQSEYNSIITKFYEIIESKKKEATAEKVKETTTEKVSD